jgi:hypothetical protein
MGVSMSSGNKKYVFTQAAAPSGEGEVEGSLWYNTTTNVLYTYTGSSWELVDSPTNMQLVETKTLTSAGTTFDFTGLDINSDGYYMIFWNVDNAVAATNELKIYVNNDTNNAHYYRQYLTASNAVVGAGRGNESVFAKCLTNERISGHLAVFLDTDDYARIIAKGTEGTGAGIVLHDEVVCSSVTFANITQLTIVGKGGNLSIGSTISIYKITRS